jgi:hypothetical protein
MKSLLSTAATFSALHSLVAAVPGGLAGLDWSIANTPETGLTDIVFPIRFEAFVHQDDTYYYSQSFNFMTPRGINGLSHVGFQSSSNIGNHTMVNAIFSTTVLGATSGDVFCSQDPDALRCFTGVEIDPADTYNIHVWPGERKNHWGCSATNARTGDKWHVGSFDLPEGTGNIEGGQSGFVEYFPWNNDTSPDCALLDYTSVIFGAPFTKTEYAGHGMVSVGYEKGNTCPNVANFQSELSNEGVKISLGWEE